MDDTCHIVVLKIGCLGVTPLIEYILDERATREDILLTGLSTGAKMDESTSQRVTSLLINERPDLVILISPNAALKGPKTSRKILSEKKVPTINITDSPGLKAFIKKKEGKKTDQTPENQGYLVVQSDPMIGARKEFLDATEMALFNAELAKVLACTGVFRYIQEMIDSVVKEIQQGLTPQLPKISLDADKAISAAGVSNPYAIAKLLAASKITESIATITSKACFKEENKEVYLPMVASAHEMLRAASRLCDEAREIEKNNDTVLRTPHSSDGSLKRKTSFMEDPK